MKYFEYFKKALEAKLLMQYSTISYESEEKTEVILSNDKVINDCYQRLMDARLFILPPTAHGKDNSQLFPDENLHEEIATPFKTCFFELNRQKLRFGVLTPAGISKDAITFGMLSHEISPGHYVLYTLVGNIVKTAEQVKFLTPPGRDSLIISTFVDGNPAHVLMGIVSTLGHDSRETQQMQFLKIYLDLIYNKENKAGISKINRKIKFKNPITKEKEFRRIKDIIIIAPKKQESVDGSFGHVEWSHRFRVMGHWRKVEAIGKDREGHYNVTGFTWVTDHVRGDESLPLIEKTRVVL